MERPGLAALHLPEGRASLKYIQPCTMQEALLTGSVLIDVRSARERTDGHIYGSLHIPAKEWEEADENRRFDLLRQVELLAGCTLRQLVFYSMYSRDRAPRVATAMADSGLEILVLRGGFQQCMAQHWPTSRLLVSSCPELFASVRVDRWVEHGSQGLVWKPDLMEMDELVSRLAERQPPFLPRTIPFMFRRLTGHALRKAAPFVYEVYGPRLGASVIPSVDQRATECFSIAHLRCHTIPFTGAALVKRCLAIFLVVSGWLIIVPRSLKVRCILCTLIHSFFQLIFTKLERGIGYYAFVHFYLLLLYMPILLDIYGMILGESPLLYVLLFPVNVWVLELAIGHATIWLHGHNVAWCYADYSDSFGNNCARLGDGLASIGLGWLCLLCYPGIINATSVLDE